MAHTHHHHAHPPPQSPATWSDPLLCSAWARVLGVAGLAGAMWLVLLWAMGAD